MKSKMEWTPEKEDELKSLWNSTSLHKLAAYFHTTEQNIKDKAQELGLGDYKSNRWTKEEEQFLIDNAKELLTEELAERLNRSIIAVQKKALKLGLVIRSTKNPWEDWMIDYVRDNINVIPIGQIQDKVGLSYYQVVRKCEELGIEYQKESWTEEEIEILRKYAKTCHYTELTKVLPRRSVGAISAKAHELGIETVSDYVKLNAETADYIKANWGKIPITQIARNLKVNISTIYRYKKALNLPDTNQSVTKKWTKKKLAKLREDAKTMSRDELAKKYKTTPKQISTIASRHKIILLDGKRKWTAELDEQLLALIDEGRPVSEISGILQMKSQAINRRLKQLRQELVKPIERKTWTEDEENTLINLSKTKTIYEIAEILGVKPEQVYHKAVRLGIKTFYGKNKNWTDEESTKLLELSKSHNLHEIASIMNRSEGIISSKAKELGIEISNKRKKWTQEELTLLEELATTENMKSIAKILGRSVASVGSKLRELGIVATASDYLWTEEETTRLHELAMTLTIDELAETFNKSKSSIQTKLYKEGIKAVTKTKKLWTKEEEQLLEELLTTYTTFEVAQILERSETAIEVRAHRLGINVDKMHRKWTEEEETYLADNWGHQSVDALAKKMNRTASALFVRAYALGLGSQIDSNYEGLKIQEVSDILGVNRNTILTTWVNLGLKLNFRKRSDHNVYSFVTIENLYKFLEDNQSLWDSRTLEKNILGTEPEWLQEKRRQDRDKDPSEFGIESFHKTKLIKDNNYYLSVEESTTSVEKPKQKIKKSEKD